MENIKAIKTSSTSLILELNINALSKKDQVRFFGKVYSDINEHEQLTFIQKDDYEFSLDFLLQLELDIRYRYLKKGEHPLHIIKDKVQVSLILFKE